MSKENKQADLPEHRDKRFDAVRDTWYWKLWRHQGNVQTLETEKR